MTLIIVCKYVFSLFNIAYIIRAYLARKRLLNCLPIAQSCNGDLMINVVDIKVYFI